MFARNGSTFLLIIRTALLLVALMCAAVIKANARDLHFVAGMKSHQLAQAGLTQSVERYSAAGRIIDAVTAQPIAGAHFVYGRPANSTDNGGFVNFEIGQTNTIGEFRLQHLKPGHYALYI